jgi:PPP family 3-phenylpropionic acid transporter
MSWQRCVGFMKSTAKVELIAIITVLGVGALSMAILQPILPLYLTSIGITPAVLGLIQSVIMVGMLLGEPSMGWLSDKLGVKIPLSIGTFICGLVVLSFILSQNVIAIFFISIFWGITRSAIFAPGRGYIGVNAPSLERAKFMAFISMTMAASRTVGALPGGLIADALGYEWVFIISAAISALGGMVVLLTKKPNPVKLEPVEAATASIEVTSLEGQVKMLPAIFSQGVVAFFFFFGFGVISSFLPLLAVQVVGISVTGVGILFSISGLVTMGLSVPMGKKLLIIAGILFSSLAMTALAFAHSFTWLVIFVTVFAIGIAMFEPASLGLIAGNVPARRLSTAMGIYGGIFENSGIIVGSALAGFIWSIWGPQVTFLSVAITGTLGMLTCLALVKERKLSSAVAGQSG